MIDYIFIAGLLYLGGVLHGALDIWSEDDTFPLTADERREMWRYLWTWPISMPLSLIDPDRRD